MAVLALQICVMVYAVGLVPTAASAVGFMWVVVAIVLVPLVMVLPELKRLWTVLGTGKDVSGGGGRGAVGGLYTVTLLTQIYIF